jgi:hypothetical protein
MDTLEDAFHQHKKYGNWMNTVKIKCNHSGEYKEIQQNTLEIIRDRAFLQKHNLSSTESILNNDNHKLGVEFKDNCIYVYFNHYFFSGPTMFVLLNRILKSEPPPFVKTNFLYAIFHLPLYFYEMMSLKTQKYPIEIQSDQPHPRTHHPLREHLMIEKNIMTNDKRYYLYLNLLQKAYHSLRMDRPMVVGISVAFDELSYVTNNVGLMIIKYELIDTVETLKQKMKTQSYQMFCSNFILQCPFPKWMVGKLEFRNYLDCVVSSMYVKSDYDINIAWNCSKAPIEPLYIGSVSILRSNHTMDTNIMFTSNSPKYHDPSPFPYIHDYFATSTR